jgi:hypothetical protein
MWINFNTLNKNERMSDDLHLHEGAQYDAGVFGDTLKALLEADFGRTPLAGGIMCYRALKKI